MKAQSVFSRFVAWGFCFLFMLVFCAAVGYAADNIVYFDPAANFSIYRQPFYQTVYLPTVNTQDNFPLFLAQDTNNRLLTQFPLSAPAVGTTVATLSFLVEETPENRCCRVDSREEWRKIADSVEQGSIDEAMKPASGG